MERRRRLRAVGTAIGAAFVLVVTTAVVLGACVLPAPRYSGPVSGHFDGDAFHDGKAELGGFTDLLRWQLDRKRGAWPDWVDAAPSPKPPRFVDGGGLRVTFVNHATVLLQMDGLNVLTDPIWSHRASPVSFAGPSRVRPPGIRFEDLPRIDAVLISHNHYDHLDLPTLRRLNERDRPLVLVGLGSGDLLRDEGVEHVRELDWWQHTPASTRVRVHSVPSQHFSSRGLTDRDGTLWTAYVVEGPSGHVYFAGDTGYGAHFKQVGARFPSLRLAVLPIGAYRPEWFMGPVHVTPAQAVQAFKDLGARHAVPMHFGTFNLADEGIDEPVADLNVALAVEPALQSRFFVLGFGEGRDIPTEAPAPLDGGEPR